MFYLLYIIFILLGCSEKANEPSEEREVVKEFQLKGTISGTIYDQATELPLLGVATTLEPGGQTSVSNEEGVFEIPDVPAGEYTLHLQHPFYHRKSHSDLTILEDQELNGLEFFLELDSSKIPTGISISGNFIQDSVNTIEIASAKLTLISKSDSSAINISLDEKGFSAFTLQELDTCSFVLELFDSKSRRHTMETLKCKEGKLQLFPSIDIGNAVPKVFIEVVHSFPLPKIQPFQIVVRGEDLDGEIESYWLKTPYEDSVAIKVDTNMISLPFTGAKTELELFGKDDLGNVSSTKLVVPVGVFYSEFSYTYHPGSMILYDSLGGMTLSTGVEVSSDGTLKEEMVNFEGYISKETNHWNGSWCSNIYTAEWEHSAGCFENGKLVALEDDMGWMPYRAVPTNSGYVEYAVDTLRFFDHQLNLLKKEVVEKPNDSTYVVGYSEKFGVIYTTGSHFIINNKIVYGIYDRISLSSSIIDYQGHTYLFYYSYNSTGANRGASTLAEVTEEGLTEILRQDDEVTSLANYSNKYVWFEKNGFAYANSHDGDLIFLKIENGEIANKKSYPNFCGGSSQAELFGYDDGYTFLCSSNGKYALVRFDNNFETFGIVE